MGLMRSIALVIISVLLIASLSAMTIGMGVNKLFYPEIYQNVFEKNNFYGIAQQKILDQTGLPEGTITREEITSGINTIISNVFSYLRSKTNELNLEITINQDRIRSYLASELNNLPTCQAGMSLPNCRPPGMTTMQLVDYMLSQSGINLAEMSKIDLSQMMPEIKDQLDSMRQIIRLFQTLILSLVLLSIIFIALLILLARKHGLAKWLGMNLLICGLIVMVIGYILPTILENIINISQSQLSVAFNDIISEVSSTILLYGIILFVLGILILAYHFIRKKPRKRK